MTGAVIDIGCIGTKYCCFGVFAKVLQRFWILNQHHAASTTS